MTAQLSRERLVERIRGEIELLQISLKNGGSDSPHNDEELLEVFRMALAGMDSKPVGYYRKGSDGFYLSSATIQREGTVPLYAAPPAPVAVPDEKWVNPDIGYADENGFAEGWNESRQYAIAKGVIPPVVKGISEHCRGWNAFGAAMLKAGPVTAATVPDGWKLVPVEPTKEMIDAGWSYYMTTKSPSSLGVYGAMLAAAPEQEV